MIRKAWNALVSWFEHGDLVPLLVVVSAVHYAAVLAGKDVWPVAIAIGLLVDLGHYRLVRAAVRYTGANRREAAARWAMVAIMTGVSLAYHQRYYSDWWLSAPLPFLIVSLAWLQRVDRQTTRSKSQIATDVPETKEPVPAVPVAAEQKKLTQAELYALTNGVSLRTAYRRLAKNGKHKETVI